MAVDPKLVRRIEGTTGSPAAVQTKQHKFDVGDSGGRDRTEHIYKDAATAEHVFITKEHTEDLISDAISTSSSGGAFTVVTTEAEFTAALEDPLILDIYCKRVSMVVATNPTNAFVTSSKNIYGGEGDFILPDAMADYRINFPTSGGVADITISFYVPILNTVGAVSDAGLGAYGGYVGSPDYKIRYKHTEKSRFNSATNVTSQYESSGTAFDSNSSLVMWSGSNSTGRTDSDTSITPTEKNILATSQSTNPTAYADYGMMARVTASATPGFETHSIDFLTALDAIDETQLKWTPFTGTYSKFETKLSNVLSSTLNSRGQLALGDFGLDPWTAEADILQLGQFGSHYSFEDSGGDKRSGIAQHCYASNNSGTWKFSTASVYAYREETVNGVTTVYVSDSTGSVDGTISLWNELLKIDENGNKANGGAAIPSLVDSNYFFEFFYNNCEMKGKISSDSYDCINCYFDGANWRSISSGDFCSYVRRTSALFQIRKSTVSATSADEIMTMTTVITPS
jgi:hypothetical protein